MQKPLLIGQAPGPNTDPDLPLYPVPRTSAGGRLAEIMGLSISEYLQIFDRTNLLHHFPGRHKRDDKFPVAKARVAADAMLPLLRGRTVIFIGRNVANSFRYVADEAQFHDWQYNPHRDLRFAVVPHTSGRSRWYNDPANRELAQEFWRSFLGDAEKKVVAFSTSQLQGRATA